MVTDPRKKAPEVGEVMAIGGVVCAAIVNKVKSKKKRSFSDMGSRTYKFNMKKSEGQIAVVMQVKTPGILWFFEVWYTVTDTFQENIMTRNRAEQMVERLRNMQAAAPDIEASAVVSVDGLIMAFGVQQGVGAD